MDREQLAEFLRRRREALTPSEVGLPAGPRRPGPGLRRDEVAMLAHMSSDYYARLEQGSGPRPSVPILTALARTLRLTEDQRDQLFRLSGQQPPARRHTQAPIGPVISLVLDRLDDVPAMVVTDLSEVVAHNELAALLFGDVMSGSGLARNCLWRWFTDPRFRERFAEQDIEQLSRNHVADLRATAARRSGDADVQDLVGRLQAESNEFARLWDEREGPSRTDIGTRIRHAEVGMIELERGVLLTGDGDQRVLVFLPRTGTDAGEKLDLLRMTGSRQLAR